MITVTGTLLDTDGNALFSEVLATPLSTPVVSNGGNIVANYSALVKTNPSTGYWSMTLAQGDYTVQFSYNNALSPTVVQISVPAGSGSTSIDQLITSSVTYTSSIPVQNYVAGTYAIPSGASSGSISGLSLGFSPRLVILTVAAPSGGLSLVATVVGPTSNTGWSFAMNAATDMVGYTLNWMAVP